VRRTAGETLAVAGLTVLVLLAPQVGRVGEHVGPGRAAVARGAALDQVLRERLVPGTVVLLGR
jgi:hypothetical protein